MPNRKPVRALKIRNIGEVRLLITMLDEAVRRGNILGTEKSIVDRWRQQLCALLPASESTSSNVLELDGTAHRPATEAETIREVFAHWRSAMKKTRARLDSKRQSLIARRLREGHTPADLKLAIDGCAASPFHQGDNDTGTRYCELSLILRNAENIERFCEMAESPPRPRSAARPIHASRDARAAWHNVIAHVRAGKHRRGESLGGAIDPVVNRIGGYSAVGMAKEHQLFDLERRFIENFLDAASTTTDMVQPKQLSGQRGHQR